MKERESGGEGDAQERARRVLAMREDGATWAEIAEALGVTRQAARYAYQIGLREERRKRRRAT